MTHKILQLTTTATKDLYYGYKIIPKGSQVQVKVFDYTKVPGLEYLGIEYRLLKSSVEVYPGSGVRLYDFELKDFTNFS